MKVKKIREERCVCDECSAWNKQPKSDCDSQVTVKNQQFYLVETGENKIVLCEFCFKKLLTKSSNLFKRRYLLTTYEYDFKENRYIWKKRIIPNADIYHLVGKKFVKSCRALKPIKEVQITQLK